MIPSDQYLMFCSEFFRELARQGPKALDRYYERIARRSPAALDAHLVPPYLTGRLADSQRFEFFHPNVKTALRFLRTTDLVSLKLGRNEVDGDNVYVNVMEPALAPYDKPGKSEAHRRYMDIQLPIVGRGETIGAYTMTAREFALPFNEKDDYVLYEAKTEPLELAAGDFVMFFPPYGGHRPGCTREKVPPKGYRKAVAKVRMY